MTKLFLNGNLRNETGAISADAEIRTLVEHLNIRISPLDSFSNCASYGSRLQNRPNSAGGRR